MKPITTVEALKSLNEDEIVKGYLAGFKGTPDYTQRSNAYWHGYMNGQVDCGAMPISTEQRMLARDVIAQYRCGSVAHG